MVIRYDNGDITHKCNSGLINTCTISLSVWTAALRTSQKKCNDQKLMDLMVFTLEFNLTQIFNIYLI